MAERLRLWPATWSYKATNHGIVERDALHPFADFYAALAAMDERINRAVRERGSVPFGAAAVADDGAPYFWLGAEAERC